MRHPVTDDALSAVKGYYDCDCLSSRSVTTAVPALVRQDPMMGYGKCSTSGCPCTGYQQTYSSELCGNCGHQYTAHW
jgi:hypothetical protein